MAATSLRSGGHVIKSFAVSGNADQTLPPKGDRAYVPMVSGTITNMFFTGG